MTCKNIHNTNMVKDKEKQYHRWEFRLWDNVIMVKTI